MKTKMLAVLAVLAMAFAGVAAFAVTEQNDADWGTTYMPTAFATDSAKKMKVLAYDDGVLLIDTNAMDLKSETQFLVELTPKDGSKFTIGPVTAQNGRIWIDATGNDLTATTPKALLNATTESPTAVTLVGYGDNTVTATASLQYSATPAKLVLKTNHSDANWSRVNYEETGSAGYVPFADYTDLKRTTGTIDMDKTMNAVFDGEAKGYMLKGWSMIYQADSNIVIQPTADMAIEDIIFAMADEIRTSDNTTIQAMTPITDGKITLFAIWEEILFDLQVGDVTASADTDFGVKDVALKISNTQKGEASITSKVSKNSFALLKIDQTVSGNYKYTITAKYSAYNEETGATTWTDATAGTEYKLQMISNGIYKVTDVTKNLRFFVKMEAVVAGDVTSNGFAFQIDQINNATDNAGFINLSLDLFDRVSTANDQLAIKGTYYKSMGDTATGGTATTVQRVYGDLRNLPGITATPYIDLEKLTENTKPKASETMVEYQVDADHKTVAKIAMKLTANDATYTDERNSVYDLSYELSGASIYAAQGVWQTVTVDGSSTTVTSIAETPWALYKA